MTHRFKSAAARAVTYALMTVIAIGLVIGGVRLVLPLADLFRTQVAGALSETLGMDVEMSRFRPRLAGMVPRLTLEDVELRDPQSGDPQLELLRLHIDLDLAASIGGLAPKVRSVTMEGARLQVERRRDGTITIAGLDGVEAGNPQAVDFFLANGRFLLAESDVHLVDRLSEAPPLKLTGVQVRFDNAGSRHRIGMRARMAEEPGFRLHLAADLEGEPGRLDDWSGDLYVELQAGELHPALGERVPVPVRLRGDRIRVQGWSSVAGSRVAGSVALVDAAGLVLHGRGRPGDAWSLRFDRLRAAVRWLPGEGVWHVRVPELDGEDVRLEMPRLFGRSEPLRFDRVSGPLRLGRTEDGGLWFESPALVLENRDLLAQTRLKVELPPGTQGPDVDLYGELEVGDAGALRSYFPAARLKPKLARWLDQAFVAGRIPWGNFLFKGRPADFPFEDGDGRLEAVLRAEDLTLSFHPQWPRLEAVDGVVRFSNARMDVDASSARLLDLSVVDAHAEIPDIRNAKSIHIGGGALGAFHNALGLLSQTPLSDRLGSLPDLFRVTGTAHLDLSMSVPLRRRGPEDRLELAGVLSWPGPASLAPVDTDLEVNALTGELRFSHQGLSRSAVRGELWGSPLEVSIDAEPGAGGKRGSTRLALSGRTPARTLAQQLPGPLWQHLRGTIPWRLDMKIPHEAIAQAGLPLSFVLTSDLRGLAVELPAPVGKGAAEVRRLRVEGAHDPGRERRLAGRYGDLAFRLRLSGQGDDTTKLKGGTIAFGSRTAPVPASDGLHLSGRLAELDLAAWSALSGPRAPGTGAGLLRSADLRIGRLRLPRPVLEDVRLRLERAPQAWEARIEASQLAGRLSLPDRPRSRPARIALERLDLQTLIDGLARPGNAPSPKPPQGDGLDPRRSHTLALSVERLHLGENALGRLDLQATALGDGLAFSEIALDALPLAQLSGDGSWRADGDRQRTVLDLEAEGEDLGEFLRHLGYASSLDEAPARAELRLSWPGGPGSVAIPALSGVVKLDIGRGSLLDVDPGVGRVLGVLNLNALRRRLSLDFSDMFQRGFAFERMHAELELGGGEAEIAEMVIEGPSAEIRIEGKADLVNRRLAQVVTVTPSLGSSVALAGAVAGGPVVGAAVLIADRVSGGAVDRLGSYQYEVRGPWSDPEITRRSLLDTDAADPAFLPQTPRPPPLPRDDRGDSRGETADRPSARDGRAGDDSKDPAPEKPNLFLDPP